MIWGFGPVFLWPTATDDRCGSGKWGASPAALALAQQAGLQPSDLVWFGGDVHLYLNHIEQAQGQLEREPRPFPTMRLTRQASSIDDYRIEDFEVEGYSPHAAIKVDVAV
ncbi:hypothetical protein BLM15_01715 [Bosea sp. Tri-49]|nr:hypothetical protein BLM15_01715 [Bosea sp. Tri-49]